MYFSADTNIALIEAHLNVNWYSIFFARSDMFYKMINNRIQTYLIFNTPNIFWVYELSWH
jgi:hypothetical protein